MHRLRYLIGLLTLAGAVAGAVWIVRILQNLDNRPGHALQVEFRDARGLRDGADVRYRGVTVGTVRSVAVSSDGSKAVAQLLLEPAGAVHAFVSSQFWIVTPRFGGLTAGATGLDTLVRDSYIAFQTPEERGSRLLSGSLLTGRERPPTETEALEDIEHGDLLMTLLVPENHGLRPGSSVIFRGMQTGDVRRVELAASGTHVEVTLRIARRHRQTVTDQTMFWVARPSVTGALFSGFTVTDASALLSPYITYYGDPGRGILVQDGFRVAAQAVRPAIEVAAVPPSALLQKATEPKPAPDEIVLVRITYAAIERDTFSADDPVHHQGTGLLYLDRAGRAVVVTARSLVDGSYTERDAFGGDPDIDDEQIKVLVADGLVRRAGRVWVDPKGRDIAALVLEDAPPDLVGTSVKRLQFDKPADGGKITLRFAGPDATATVASLPAEGAPTPDEIVGGAILAGERVFAICGLPTDGRQILVPLELLPEDLRPQ